MTVKRAELVAAATELNKVMGLDPQIDVTASASEVRRLLLEAAELITDRDPVDEKTRATIESLKSEGGQAEGQPAAKPASPKPAAKPVRQKATGAKRVAGGKAPTGAKARPAPAPRNGDGRQRFEDAAVISMRVKENPKQEGSAAHGRFALYQDGMTVGKFLAAGGLRADLSWDTKKGFIEVAAA